MPNFQVMSDLHLEFQGNITNALQVVKDIPVTADVLILAGDIHNKHIERCLKEFAKKWRLIIFVPGNHEYYGERFQYQLARFKKIESFYPNVKILLNGLYTDNVSGLRFAGTTLWFPYNNETASNQHMLNDFRLIKESAKLFDFNINAQKFLRHAVFDNDLADIVVTHHAPTILAIKGEFKDDPANCYYVTPILDNEYCCAKIWIHGHTHVSNDFIHPLKTRIISNAAGYAWDVQGFNPGRVYEYD